MAYNIWISLQARDILELLQNNEPELYQQIQDALELLSMERENFITGAPSKNEVFILKSWKVYYRVWHRLQSIEVVKIVELL
jgi:hypothetical protein